MAHCTCRTYRTYRMYRTYCSCCAVCRIKHGITRMRPNKRATQSVPTLRIRRPAGPYPTRPSTPAALCHAACAAMQTQEHGLLHVQHQRAIKIRCRRLHAPALLCLQRLVVWLHAPNCPVPHQPPCWQLLYRAPGQQAGQAIGCGCCQPDEYPGMAGLPQRQQPGQ